MPVTSVEKLWSGRGATDTHLNHRTFRERWEIVCDIGNEDIAVVGNADGLPQVGSVHEEDSGAYLVDIDLEQNEENPFYWHATLSYDSKPELPESYNPGDGGEGSDSPGGGGPGNTPADVSENPLLRPAQWSVAFTTDSRPTTRWNPVTTAILGEPPEEVETIHPLTAITNSARFLFDPPPMVQTSNPVLRVTKNIAPPGLRFYEKLQDAINATEWKGLPPRTARIGGVQGQGGIENGVSFVALTLEIAINRQTWDLRLLDCGYSERRVREDPLTLEEIVSYAKIRDVHGEPSSVPVPLDGNGYPLPFDGEPVYKRGIPEEYQQKEFSVLLDFLD